MTPLVKLVLHHSLDVLQMNKKATLKDWMFLFAGGIGMATLFYGAIALVALLIGLLVAAISDVSWLIATIFTFIGIRLVIEGADAIIGLKSTRCPECRRKIKTSKPVKCVDCGGPALLKKNRRMENNTH